MIPEVPQIDNQESLLDYTIRINSWIQNQLENLFIQDVEIYPERKLDIYPAARLSDAIVPIFFVQDDQISFIRLSRRSFFSFIEQYHLEYPILKEDLIVHNAFL